MAHHLRTECDDSGAHTSHHNQCPCRCLVLLSIIETSSTSSLGVLFFNAHPFHRLRTCLFSFSPTTTNSDPGVTKQAFLPLPPLPTAVRAFFLPSSLPPLDSSHFCPRRLASNCCAYHTDAATTKALLAVDCFDLILFNFIFHPPADGEK